jgi:hypothetical protein
MASLLVAWLQRSRTAPQVPTNALQDSTGRRLVLVGLSLFAALITGLSWLFRPGNSPDNFAGGHALNLLIPLAVICASVLVVLGTIRLSRGRSSAAGRVTLTDTVFNLIGVLASVAGVTLCINLLTDIALGR